MDWSTVVGSAGVVLRGGALELADKLLFAYLPVHERRERIAETKREWPVFSFLLRCGVVGWFCGWHGLVVMRFG